MRGTLANQAAVSWRGLPGGSARRGRPTSFSNLHMVLSLAGPGAGPVDLIGTAFAKSPDIPSVPASARCRPAQAAAARRDSYLRKY